MPNGRPRARADDVSDFVAVQEATDLLAEWLERAVQLNSNDHAWARVADAAAEVAAVANRLARGLLH